MKTSPKKSGKFLSLLKEFFSWLAYQNVRAQVVVFLTIFLVLFLLVGEIFSMLAVLIGVYSGGIFLKTYILKPRPTKEERANCVKSHERKANLEKESIKCARACNELKESITKTDVQIGRQVKKVASLENEILGLG